MNEQTLTKEQAFNNVAMLCTAALKAGLIENFQSAVVLNNSIAVLSELVNKKEYEPVPVRSINGVTSAAEKSN